MKKFTYFIGQEEKIDEITCENDSKVLFASLFNVVDGLGYFPGVGY